jgi:hypothetical protein
MTSSTPEPAGEWPDVDHLPAEELARRQGIGPLASVADLAFPGAFESDAEFEEFLTDLYASRRAGLA